MKVLRDSGRSDQTINHYATCWKSFSKWTWKDRRTRTDLLADLEPPKVVTTAKRAALPPELTARLIESTRLLPRRRSMSGEDRAWLYTLAAITGLRRGELQALTPESFSLEGNPAVVSLPGCDTKNSDNAIQPLPSHVIPALRSWLAGKSVGRPLWPEVQDTALMLRNDLKAAGIAPDAYCFHSLRHSYVTAIIQCGGSIKDSMELARHHDADLTFGRYAHTRLADLSQVVNRLPALWEDSSHTLPISGVSAGPNGTTLDHQEPCPERSQVDPLGHDYRFRPPVACSDGLPLVGIMLGRDVDDPDLLEVVERTVEPFAPEEHAATAPVGAATQVNHQPFRREGQGQTPATNQDTDQREENQEQDRIHIRGGSPRQPSDRHAGKERTKAQED